MKKILFVFLAFFLLISNLYAAGSSNTATGPFKLSGGYLGNAWYLKFSWVADDSDGSVPDATYKPIIGYIVRIVTDPGTTAPTDDYDVALNDQYGCDLLGGEGANRDTSTTEQTVPKIGNAYGGALIPGQITCSISGNSVNSATGDVYVFIAPIED